MDECFDSPSSPEPVRQDELPGSTEFVAVPTGFPEIFISAENLNHEVLDQYIKLKMAGCRYNTRRLTHTALTRFLSAVDRHKKASLLDTYLSHAEFMRTTMAAKTYHRELGRIRAFLTWCVAMGYLDKNPALLCRTQPGRHVKQRLSIISESDYERIKKACDEKRNRPAKELIMTGYWTGMSISDCCLLQWGSIDLEKMTITSDRLKSGVQMEIPLIAGSEFHRYLIDNMHSMTDESWPNNPEQKLFFVNPFLAAAYLKLYRDGSKMLTSWIRSIMNHAGLRHHTFHDLRRTMATMLANDPDVATGSAIRVMGWSNTSMISNYMREGSEKLQESFRKAMAKRHETLEGFRHDRELQTSRLRAAQHPQIEDHPGK